MTYKIEVIILPVSNVDRALAFYTEKAGFMLDVDYQPSDEFRVVQLTPPGSSCSVQIGVGLTDAAPGSIRGLHAVVEDLQAARDELVSRGVTSATSGTNRRSTTGEATGNPDWIPTATTTPASPTSPTRTATNGCFKSAASTTDTSASTPAEAPVSQTCLAPDAVTRAASITAPQPAVAVA
jgi:hypothetical protein